MARPASRALSRSQPLDRTQARASESRGIAFRVLVLTHAELYARDSIRGLSEREVFDWRTEYQVVHGLRSIGHEVAQLGLDWSLMPLHAMIDDFKPHVVFNLLIELRNSGGFEPHVVAALEARGIPYTGCNSEGITLARDKSIAKKLLRAEGVPVPDFAIFRRGRVIRPRPQPRFPLIVKPIDGSGSFGISRASVVRSVSALQGRVEMVHRRCGTDAIAESYLEGREFTIGVMGNQRLECLPLWETFFDGLPAGAPRIATERLKWNPEHRRSLAVTSGRARSLPSGTRRSIARFARRSYRVLHLSSFARVDFRLDREGRPFVIDVNASPDVDFLEDFARSAEASGIPPLALLERLLRLGLRYRPRWAQDGC